MATVIDSLVVTLGLDASKFTAGQKQSVEALKKTGSEATVAGKHLEDAGKKSAQAFSSLKKELLAVGAAFVGVSAIKNFVQSTVLSTAALGRMSDNLGISALRMAQWQNANKMAGGTAEEMSSILQQATEDMANYNRGLHVASMDEFSQRQGNTQNLTDANSLLIEKANILERIRKTEGEGAAYTSAGKMGVAGAYNVLKHGGASVEKLLTEQSARAKSEADASKQTEELRKEFVKLTDNVAAAGIQILTGLLPAIKAVADMIEPEKFKKAYESVVGTGSDFLMDAKKKRDANTAANLSGSRGPAMKWLEETVMGNKLPDKRGVSGKFPADPASWSTGKSGAYNSPELNAYADEVNRREGLPPGLLNSVKNAGERSNSNQVSPKGAKGVMQFMPKTWGQYGKGDPTDPHASIDAGGRYFKDLLKRYGGNVDAAITEYNGGMVQARRVQAGGSPTDPETIGYLSRVKKHMGQANVAGSMAMGKSARDVMMNGAQSSNTSSIETNINGPITIQTQATDAVGIAQSLNTALLKYNYVANSNTGLA